MAEHLVQASLDPRRQRALEPGRLLVGLRPAEPDHGRQEPLEKGVAAEDRIGSRPAGRRQHEVAAIRLADEAVGDEPPEHLARGLRGDAEVAADLARP
jgi:hypothetical protein